MKIKKIVSLLVIVACVLVIMGGEGKAEKKAQWTIVSSGSGSSPYMIISMMGNMLNENMKNINLSSQVSAGFLENIRLVGEGDSQLGATSSHLVSKAHEKYPDLRVLFNAFAFPMHFIVQGDEGIKKIEDLKGKTVNIGAPGQATRKIGTILLKNYGLALDDIKVSSLNTGDGISAMKDKQVDATIAISSILTPSILEMSISNHIDLLPVTGPNADKFNEEIGGIMNKTVIPAKMYQKIDHDTKTLSAGIVIMGSKDLDADLVYEFVRTFWDNISFLQGAQSAFKTVQLNESAINTNWKMPIHLGAKRYYKEKGIL